MKICSMLAILHYQLTHSICRNKSTQEVKVKLTISKAQTQVIQGNSVHTKNPSDSSMKKHYGAFVTVGGDLLLQ